jgi:drug/metabolite transporter (DMT)-like permease
MIYLLACVISALGWTVSYRISLHKGCDPVGTLAGIGCSSVIVSYTIFFSQIRTPCNTNAVLIGVSGGMCMYFAVFSYFHLLKGGARLGISWTVVTLSMTIPYAGSILLWHELPGFLQWLSLLLTVASIVLLGRIQEKGTRLTKRDIFLLSTAFLLSGIGALLIKTLVALGLEKFRNTYFVSLHSTMLLIAIGGNLLGRHLPSKRELLFGGAMGLAGMGNYWFILFALRELPGIVAFPFRTCGSIVLTLFVSRVVWRERLAPGEVAGVVLAMAAIVLMSL